MKEAGNDPARLREEMFRSAAFSVEESAERLAVAETLAVRSHARELPSMRSESSCIVAFIAAIVGCSGRDTVGKPETPAVVGERDTVKLMINLTDAAVAALEDDLGPGAIRRDDHPLRVAVEGDPASGYSYYFGFADDPNEPQYRIDNQRDVIEVVEGFPVVVRREHVQYLTGTTIDYVTSPTEGAGFKFDNPRGALAPQMTSTQR